MAQEDHSLVEVHGVELRERSPGPEAVHNLHRLGVLDFALSRYGHVVAGEKRISGDHRGNDVLMGGAGGALVVIGQRSQAMAGDQLIQCHRGPGGAFEFLRLAFAGDLKFLSELG